MTIHIMRDYSPAGTGYFAPGGGITYFETPYVYTMSLFLHKVLGYSIVGQNDWDIINTNVQTLNNAATSAIAAASNGQTLPQSTIFVGSTAGFPNSGVAFVSASVSTTTDAASNGQTLPQSTINVASTAAFMSTGSFQIVTTAGTQTVTYTGVNGSQFTGCTGGTGTMATGNAVTGISPQIVKYSGLTTGALLNCTGGSGTMTAGQSTTTTGIQALPTATINVASTTGFPTSGTIYIVTSAGVQTITYTGTGATTFTGCTGGTGNTSNGGAVTSTGGAVSCTPLKIVSNTGTPSNITLNFPHGMTTGQYVNVSGTTTTWPISVVSINQMVLVTTGSGTGTVGAIVYPPGMLIASGSVLGGTGATINPTFASTTIAAGSNGQTLPQATINVVSTATFPSSGTIYVTTTTGIQAVTYTGTSGSTQFTGCSGGTGIMTTGNLVTFSGGNSSLSVSIPPSVRTVLASGAAPSAGDNGRILVFKSTNYPTKNSGLFKISTVTNGNSTTIAAGSNNVTLPQATINVTSTTGFPTSGTLFVYTSTGVQSVAYTGTSGGTQFTGCTGGTGTMSTNNTVNNFNGYTIDYRSTDTPPSETVDWWLYEIETQVSNYVGFPNNSNVTTLGILSSTNTSPIQITTNFASHADLLTGQKVTISGHTINTNANGTWTITVPNPLTSTGVFTLNGSSGNGAGAATGSVTRNGYTGGSLSFNSKVLLQSPHPSGWQVRIAVEPFNISFMPITSVSVGYGGLPSGDFPVGGITTHTAQFTDLNPTNTGPGLALQGSIPGSSIFGSVAQRVSIVGDDTGQAVFVYARSLGATANGLVTFGIPDNEPTPLQPNINRPFVYGGVSTADFGGIQMRMGSTLNNFGLTYRDVNPEVAAIAGWVNLDGTSGAVPAYSANAGDSPFTGTTEVLPWEVWGGIATDPSLNLPFDSAKGAPPYGLNQRFMGTAPFIRQGRTNFGNFTLSTDSTATSNISSVTAAAPIQITTTATNALATGQTVTISGVQGVPAANGTFVITVIDNTHFTLNGTSGSGSYTGGGIVQGTAHWIHLQNGIYLQWNGAGGLTP